MSENIEVKLDYKNSDFDQSRKETQARLENDYINCDPRTIEDLFSAAEFGGSKEIKQFYTELKQKIVDHLMNKYKITSIRDDGKKEMWVTIDGLQVPNGISYLKTEVEQILQKRFKSALFNEIIDIIEARTYMTLEDYFIKSAEKTQGLILTNNCIVNIHTGEIVPPNDDLKFFNRVPWDYDPEADCPKIKQFLLDCTDDDTKVEAIREYVGYALSSENNFEKSLILVGMGDIKHNGGGGKSTTADIINELLGKMNCSNQTLQDLITKPFSQHLLFGSYANIANDIPDKTIIETNEFMRLNDGTILQVNRKGLSYLRFVNRCKFIFTCNVLPVSTNKSYGWSRRWIIIEYPFKFVAKNKYQSEYDKGARNLKIKDPHLKKKLINPREMSGFLNWCIKGYQNVIERGEFSISNGDKWAELSDSLNVFCEKYIEKSNDKDDYIIGAEFRKKYSNFCDEKQMKIFPDQSIKRVLTTDYGCTYKQISPRIDEDRPWVWSGIKWRTEE